MPDHGVRPTSYRSGDEPPTPYAARMKGLEQDVRALLHAAQQECKTVQDRDRVDIIFRVGDQVLPRVKELLKAAEIGKLRPRNMDSDSEKL